MKVLINLKIQAKTTKGISLIALVITVLVLMIFTNIIIYKAEDNLKVGKLKEMQNDIKNLRDKISSFYATNGKIPAKLVYDNEEAIGKIRVAGVISDKVDTGNFMVIDLSALENVTLNRGQDYKKVKELDILTDEAKQYADLYIINEASHNIFYVEGITIDNEIFYTDYGAEEVDEVSVNLRYVDNVKIPEGFYYAGGSKEEGLVISDKLGDDLENSKKGNQFVWVPVEDMDNFVRIAGYSKGSQQSLTNSIEPFTSGYSTEKLEYNDMKQSVKENKGFYIGRFEAGKDNLENVVVKKGVNVYNNVPWGKSMSDISQGAVKLAKEFASNNGYQGVTSTLCYGVQWDATMQFMDSEYISGTCGADSYVRNSTNRGYYSASSPATTGYKPEYAEKNIYDMAGNVVEWTMEAYEVDKRTYRGGRYGVDGFTYPASSRYNFYFNTTNEHIGFRIALYLNESEENWSPKYDKEGIYKDKNGDTAYIPQGFQVARKNGQNTIDEGLVVRDSNKNEFVWVPVDNIANFKPIEGYFNGLLESKLTNCSEPFENGYSTEKLDYDAMRKSVESNKGFYIGRYEAGKDSEGNVVVKKDADVYNNVSWGNAVNDIEETSNTEEQVEAIKLVRQFATKNEYQGVTSTLCYGVQWDMTLKFIDPEYTGFAKDSSRQGWYAENYNSTNSGNIETNPNKRTGKELIYSDKPNVIANKQKNIYDMAGNVWEWTMEAYNAERVVRGGDNSREGFKNSASYRGHFPSNTNDIFLGFRIALYLNEKEKE